MASSRRLPTSYNVSTYGTDSRDYSSLATWEAATDINLVTAAKGEVLECYDDETSFDDIVSIAGATTNSSYFRVIKPAAGEGHDGTPNTGVRFSSTSVPNISGVITVTENYVQIHDLDIFADNWATNCNYIYVTNLRSGSAYSFFIGCLLSGDAPANHKLVGGKSDPANCGYINCTVYEINNAGTGTGDGFWLPSIGILYNCTVVDCESAAFTVGASVVIKNCISCDNGTNTIGGTKTTCYEGDDVTFLDQGSDDYHLFHGDATCIGNGTDLSADGTYAFDDDIDGNTRTRWDIGADEGGPWASRRLPLSYNVTTYGTDSRDYSSLATWEAATDNDLVTATKGEVLECYDDETSFDDGVNIGGATTNSSYFRVIKPATGEGHDGTPNNGVTFDISTFQNVGGGYEGIIVSSENYVQFHDLIVKITANNSNIICVLYIGHDIDCNYNVAVGCITTGTNSGSGGVYGIASYKPNNHNLYIDCLCFNCDIGFLVNSRTHYMYNCTAVDCGTGFKDVSSTSTCINCIACDNTTDFDSIDTKTTCYEGDDVTFLDQGSDDYHLDESERTQIMGGGTDLSGDATYAFDDDIDGNARTWWDIGFAKVSKLSSRMMPMVYNVSTYGTDSRDYSSLATWEAATDNDLVTATKGEVLECYDDETSFDDSVSIAGATTNSSYFRVIKPATGEGHDGTPNNGVTFNTTDQIVMNIQEDYFHVHDLIIITTHGTGYCVNFYGNEGMTAVGCLVSGVEGIHFESVSPKKCYAINCVAYDCSTSGFSKWNSATYIYNCTTVNCGTGFAAVHSTGTDVVINCLGCDNTDNFSGVWTTETTNYDGTTTVFKDQANDDYHLFHGDATCIGNGTDLSADGTYAFDDDIDGNTRTRWDIGADEGGPWASRRLPLSYNVTTYGTDSRDYSSLATWEAATDNDLVTATKGEVLECYDDETSFDDSVNIGGATTNSSYFRVIKPAVGEGHNGTPATGVKIRGTANNQLQNSEEHSQIQDLVVETSGGDASKVDNATGAFKFVGCIFKSSSGNMGGKASSVAAVGSLAYINCLAYDCGMGFRGSDTSTKFYNCTAVDCTTGFGGSGTAKNCCACDNTTNWSVTWTKTTCYEGDATVFANQAGDDYHLAAGDTTARGNGTDLSADAVYAFDDDIDGTTRAAWDIGFDEYGAASGWAGKVLGVTGIAKINGILIANIAKVMGV